MYVSYISCRSSQEIGEEGEETKIEEGMMATEIFSSLDARPRFTRR